MKHFSRGLSWPKTFYFSRVIYYYFLEKIFECKCDHCHCVVSLKPTSTCLNTHYPIQCLLIIHIFYPIFLGPWRKSVEHFSTDDKGHFFHKWTHKPFRSCIQTFQFKVQFSPDFYKYLQHLEGRNKLNSTKKKKSPPSI